MRRSGVSECVKRNGNTQWLRNLAQPPSDTLFTPLFSNQAFMIYCFDSRQVYLQYQQDGFFFYPMKDKMQIQHATKSNIQTWKSVGKGCFFHSQRGLL